MAQYSMRPFHSHSTHCGLEHGGGGGGSDVMLVGGIRMDRVGKYATVTEMGCLDKNEIFLTKKW